MARWPAADAYVQLQNLVGDFQGEVRTNADGRFLLHPVPGRWRLIAWLPDEPRAELEIQIGTEDLEVEIDLA